MGGDRRIPLGDEQSDALLFSRDGTEPFPAWQGMQYFVSMFSGQAQLHHLDNLRYGQRQ